MQDFDILKKLTIERHSWREYDQKKITDQDLQTILEVARHTPTAFGSEPYHLLITSNNEIKKAIQPYIWNQPQVLSCSHLFIILSYKKNIFTLNNENLELRYGTRYNNDSDTSTKLQNKLISYLTNNVKDWDEWAKRQAYIFLHNLIITAYAKNIVTSPMEGFSHDDLLNYLEQNHKIPKNTFNIAVVLAAGYPPEDKELIRKSKFLTVNELVTIIE